MGKNLLIGILLMGLLPKGYSQDKFITLKNDTVSSEPFKRIRFGMTGGIGYLIGSSKKAEENMVSTGLTKGQARSYYNDMKSGMYAQVDLGCLITPKYGIGIKYKFFDTSSSIEGFFDPQDGVSLIYTTYKEQIYVNFAGASLFYQQSIGSQESFKINYTYSLGLTTYRNEAEYLNGYYLLTGKSVGIDGSLGLEYFIAPWFSIGTDLSVFYSSIRKIKLSDGSNTTSIDLEKDNYENLSRFDLSIGIRLYLWNK